MPNNEDEHLKQIRKDKCTTEQFWAVATILGVNAFLLIQQANLTFAAHWVIILHSAFISFYATWFVIDRAKAYREIDTGSRGLQLSDLKGLGIYLYLILSSFCAVTVLYT
jgi:hypothetical protein